MGLYKLRVVYGRVVVSVSLAPYKEPVSLSLKIVERNDIDYSFKYEDRSVFADLLQYKGDCDDILIVKDGLVTDTSYGNIVYEMDGSIKACAALHLYNDKQAEIAAIAVDETCSHLGTGPKLVNYLLALAKEKKCTTVFVLTTQTADWFLQLGFKESTIDSLPLVRKNQWTEKRGSKVFRLKFHVKQL